MYSPMRHMFADQSKHSFILDKHHEPRRPIRQKDTISISRRSQAVGFGTWKLWMKALFVAVNRNRKFAVCLSKYNVLKWSFQNTLKHAWTRQRNFIFYVTPLIWWSYYKGNEWQLNSYHYFDCIRGWRDMTTWDNMPRDNTYQNIMRPRQYATWDNMPQDNLPRDNLPPVD